jgi:hypothetical protein
LYHDQITVRSRNFLFFKFASHGDILPQSSVFGLSQREHSRDRGQKSSDSPSTRWFLGDGQTKQFFQAAPKVPVGSELAESVEVSLAHVAAEDQPARDRVIMNSVFQFQRKRPVNPIFKMLYGRGIMCGAPSFVQ